MSRFKSLVTAAALVIIGVSSANAAIIVTAVQGGFPTPPANGSCAPSGVGIVDCFNMPGDSEVSITGFFNNPVGAGVGDSGALFSHVFEFMATTNTPTFFETALNNKSDFSTFAMSLVATVGDALSLTRTLAVDGVNLNFLANLVSGATYQLTLQGRLAVLGDGQNATYNTQARTAIPLPATLLLFASALAGLGFVSAGRRRLRVTAT